MTSTMNDPDNISEIEFRIGERLKRSAKNTASAFVSVDSLAQTENDKFSEVAFLSEYVREFVKRKQRLRQPHCSYGKGAVLFVDISGFTKLGKKLRESIREESEATEKLAIQIMSALQRLTAMCLDMKGDVCKFAGDALLCVWKDGQKKDCILQAQATGLRMLQAIKQFSQGLDLHGGISYGTLIDFNLVRKVNNSDGLARWHLLSGSALSVAGDLVDKAPVGTIYLSDNGEVKVINRLSAIESYKGSEMSLSLGSRSPCSANWDLRRDIVVSYIPHLVLNKIRGGDVIGGEIISNVAIIFIALDSLVLSQEELEKIRIDKKKIKRLNSAFGNLLSIIRNSGGEIRDLLFDDKGCICIGVFGAHVITENSEQKAVVAGQRVLLKYKNARVGISSGACYAGLCGTKFRNDFVVIGHEVNQAARFSAQAKPGQILVSQIVKLKHLTRYEFEPYSFVKKNDQFRCYILGKEKDLHEQLMSTPSILCLGRKEEETNVSQMLEEDDRVIIISGEKGIGKTSFLFHLKSVLEESCNFVYCTAEETEMDTYVFVFKQILLAICNLTEEEFNVTKLQEMAKLLNIQLSHNIIKILGVKNTGVTALRFERVLGSLRSTGRKQMFSRPGSQRPRRLKHKVASMSAINRSLNNSHAALKPRHKHIGSGNNSTLSKISISSFNEHLSDADLVDLSVFLTELLNATLEKTSKKEILVVVDDAHFIDTTSLTIISEMLNTNLNRGIKFIFSYRNMNNLSPIARLNLDALVGTFTSSFYVELLELEPKAIENISAYHLRDHFGIPNSENLNLDEALLKILVSGANGLPNCLSLLIKYYIEEDMFHFDKDQNCVFFKESEMNHACEVLPKELTEIACFRLNSLDGLQKRVIKLAACIGYQFSRKRLWRILKRDQAPFTHDDFLQILLTLTELDFITRKTLQFSDIQGAGLSKDRKGSEPDMYEFTWTVYFEAVNSLIPSARKAEVIKYLNMEGL